MPAFEKKHDGDAILVYCWEDDDTVEWSVRCDGPIEAKHTKDDEAIPPLVIKGDKTFVLKRVDYVEGKVTRAMGRLHQWCVEAGTDVDYFLEWVLGDNDDSFCFGSDDGPEMFGWDENGYRREQVIELVEEATGKTVPESKRRTMNFRCAC